VLLGLRSIWALCTGIVRLTVKIRGGYRLFAEAPGAELWAYMSSNVAWPGGRWRSHPTSMAMTTRVLLLSRLKASAIRVI
jgi:hypothetical protein